MQGSMVNMDSSMKNMDPMLVYLYGMNQQLAGMTRQVTAMNHSVQNMANSVSLIQHSARNLDRRIGPMMGMSNSSHWAHDMDNPENKRFVAEFEKEYKRLPSLYASQGYDAALMMDAAVLRLRQRRASEEGYLW